MPKTLKQTTLFRGIYDFDDPTGSLIAARIPYEGAADLYDGTALIVRPNQCAVLIYKGKIADVFSAGTHEIRTENLPVLTQLANIKFGFRNPVRCEIYFFAGQAFPGRRWGTAHPVMVELDGRALPLRGYGNYTVRIQNPKNFLLKLLGTRSVYSISDLEDFIQAQLVELLPLALEGTRSIRDLSRNHKEISSRLLGLAAKQFEAYGVALTQIQLLSLLPSKEVLEALDERFAMDLVGDKKEYLLYKAASTLDTLPSGQSDSMHTMMGLMLGRTLIGADYRQKENALARENTHRCPECQTEVQANQRFCGQCGKGLSK